MELELKQDSIACYEVIAEHTICQEETLETIVPDAYPDILRIIDVSGQALIVGKQADEGRAAIEAVVLATVLYQPEGEQGIRRMDVQIPFTIKQDMEPLTSSSVIHASVRMHSSDARILNPRKILVRADLITEISAFEERKHIIPTAAEVPDGCDLCQNQNQLEYIHLIAVPERIFQFADEIRFQHGGTIPTLMSCRCSARSVEERLIGNKLIFKGNIEVDLLLSDGEGTLSQRRETLPFSQILEIPETEEATNCQICVEVMSFSCTPDLEEDGRIRLEMDLLAQAQIRSVRHTTLLTDIYSTTHEMEAKQTTWSFCFTSRPATCSQNVRALLETDDLIRSIADTQVFFSPITQQWEGSKLTLMTKYNIHILYLNENQQIKTLEKDALIRAELECEPDVSCSDCKIIPGEIITLAAAGGVEVRLSMDFQCLLQRHSTVKMISEAQLGALRSMDSPRPSVVLRLASPEESLWDIAKIYGTTTQRILQANELEENGLFHGKMLLIPSGR